ncbi:MAG: hypothetical protein D6753_18305, partial [Planctomycetota bacterium]
MAWKILSLALVLISADDPIAQYRQEAIERWEPEIRKLEQLDRQETDPPHAILFVGSSSIRLWDSIADDMRPWPVIRRGYGGARFSDLAVFINRLVDPHQFDALAIFVANDISGKGNDKTPEEVLRLVRYCVEQVRQKHPDQPIFLIGITPTSSRFHAWPQIRQVNRLMAEYCQATEGLYYVDTAPHFLDEDGNPRDELFRDDRLHLNASGYK